MINPILGNRVTFKGNSNNGNTKASIFYINDLHGQSIKMERMYNASKSFDQFTPSGTDKLKFSSGDTMLGENPKTNIVAEKFLNLCNVMATAIGNHECDISTDALQDITKDATYKIVGANVKINDNSPLSKKFVKSYIQEANGNKYGIIGLMPPDLFTRIKYGDKFKDFKVEDMDATIKTVQNEVDNLKKQGVDKIIVLSHTGNSNEKRLAQETSGIDVILGGHSHELIKDIKKGENLLTSKSGEPVIITQAGKNADHFGVLNVEFDKNGVIVSAQNNVSDTKDFGRNSVARNIFEKILGKPEQVGEVKYADPLPQNSLIEENPHASFLADAMRSELKTDIALINSANIRGGFEVGKVDSRDISAITPFKNTMTIVPLNEKQLVEGLKFGAASITKAGSKPGIFEVSGLEYTMNKKGQLLDLKIQNADGTKRTVDTNNPDEKKVYRVAMDDYCSMGKDGFDMMNVYDKAEKVFDFDKDKLACDYIKHLNAPIEVKKDGRIKIVD